MKIQMKIKILRKTKIFGAQRRAKNFDFGVVILDKMDPNPKLTKGHSPPAAAPVSKSEINEGSLPPCGGGGASQKIREVE